MITKLQFIIINNLHGDYVEKQFNVGGSTLH